MSSDDEQILAKEYDVLKSDDQLILAATDVEDQYTVKKKIPTEFSRKTIIQ